MPAVGLGLSVAFALQMTVRLLGADEQFRQIAMFVVPVAGAFVADDVWGFIRRVQIAK